MFTNNCKVMKSNVIKIDKFIYPTCKRDRTVESNLTSIDCDTSSV